MDIAQGIWTENGKTKWKGVEVPEEIFMDLFKMHEETERLKKEFALYKQNYSIPDLDIITMSVREFKTIRTILKYGGRLWQQSIR